MVYLLPNGIRPNVFYDTMYICRALRGPGPKKGGWGSRGARVAGLGWVQLPRSGRGARALDLGPRSKDSVGCRPVVVRLCFFC